MTLRLLLALVAVLSLLAVLASADASQTKTHFGPDLTIDLPVTTPEMPSDFAIHFNLPSGDVQFAGVAFFVPPDWGVVKSDAIPIGASVGRVTATATLGLFNGACDTAIPVEFDLQNASIDTTHTVSFGDLNLDGIQDFAEDSNHNGILDGIDRYPDWLLRIFHGLQPIRRSAGISIVGGISVILQFLIFPPGTAVSDGLPSDPSLGYPTATVLEDLGDPGLQAIPSPITNFCTPLLTADTFFGATPQGQALFINPMSGRYDFTTIAVGQRDADGDGIENALDTCPFDPNVGDPRIPYSGNISGDGIDAACDPNANNPSPNSDRDGDGYLNRGDNCPFVPNGEAQAFVPGVGNQKDSDLDQIGDACDPHPQAPDGYLSVVRLTRTATIGDGSGPGGPPGNCPDCYNLGPLPSPAPPGGVPVQGDVNCSGAVDPVDALGVLRHVASLPRIAPPLCLDIGSQIGGGLFGDVDCDGDVSAVDALDILRNGAALPYQQTPPCPGIGTEPQ